MSTGIRARLDAMQARAEAATEGPWDTVPTVRAAIVAFDNDDSGYWTDVADGFETEADAAFVAAARSDLPALLRFARDVLDLHTPVTHGPANGWVGAPFMECRECRRSWPCPTAAAAEHLGGGSDD